MGGGGGSGSGGGGGDAVCVHLRIGARAHTKVKVTAVVTSQELSPGVFRQGSLIDTDRLAGQQP